MLKIEPSVNYSYRFFSNYHREIFLIFLSLLSSFLAMWNSDTLRLYFTKRSQPGGSRIIHMNGLVEGEGVEIPFLAFTLYH